MSILISINELHDLNIFSILLTFEVSKLLISIISNELQPSNMEDILFTEIVFKFEISINFNKMQSWKRWDISLVLLVNLKFDKFIEVKDSQPRNI